MILKRTMELVVGLFLVYLIIPTHALANTDIFYGRQTLKPLIQSGTLVASLPGGTVVEPASNQTRYMVSDHLDSYRVALDTGNNSLVHYEYTPYGEVLIDAVDDMSSRYAGHSYNRLQAVYETPNRNYDPTTTRFLGLDKKRIDPSPYIYAGNNPIIYLDLTGNGQTPFFLMSGIKDSDNIEKLQKNLLLKLSGTEKGTLRDTDLIFYDQLVWGEDDGKEIIHEDLKWLEQAVKGDIGGQSHFTEDLFWFIGKDSMLPLKYFESTMKKLRTWNSRLAERIVLIDLSNDGDNFRNIRDKIHALGQTPEVGAVRSDEKGRPRYVSNHTQSPLPDLVPISHRQSAPQMSETELSTWVVKEELILGRTKLPASKYHPLITGKMVTGKTEPPEAPLMKEMYGENYKQMRIPSLDEPMLRARGMVNTVDVSIPGVRPMGILPY